MRCSAATLPPSPLLSECRPSPPGRMKLDSWRQTSRHERKEEERMGQGSLTEGVFLRIPGICTASVPLIWTNGGTMLLSRCACLCHDPLQGSARSRAAPGPRLHALWTFMVSFSGCNRRALKAVYTLNSIHPFLSLVGLVEWMRGCPVSSVPCRRCPSLQREQWVGRLDRVTKTPILTSVEYTTPTNP